MNEDLLIGAAALAVGFGLVVVGWPRKGESPRFLRFPAALVLYPPLVMVFIAAGVAELITWGLR